MLPGFAELGDWHAEAAFEVVGLPGPAGVTQFGDRLVDQARRGEALRREAGSAHLSVAAPLPYQCPRRPATTAEEMTLGGLPGGGAGALPALDLLEEMSAAFGPHVRGLGLVEGRVVALVGGPLLAADLFEDAVLRGGAPLDLGQDGGELSSSRSWLPSAPPPGVAVAAAVSGDRQVESAGAPAGR
ncbi:hypothetical protein [Dactylosporangium darangshiense]|uniref:Uncharacterized protein n=1 Tax=Dactylosporangium darangshiense TaxID=579108 RepID=A0ABP8DN55_9ACTN